GDLVLLDQAPHELYPFLHESGSHLQLVINRVQALLRAVHTLLRPVHALLRPVHALVKTDVHFLHPPVVCIHAALSPIHASLSPIHALAKSEIGFRHALVVLFPALFQGRPEFVVMFLRSHYSTSISVLMLNSPVRASERGRGSTAF